MSEMIERLVGVAIDHLDTDPFGVIKHASIVSAVRAMLVAMREPTDGMFWAGARSGDWSIPDADDAPDPKMVWVAMIDEALKP